MKAERKKKFATCHPKITHFAKGLCKKCYFKQKYRASRAKGRVNPKTPGFVEQAMNTWQDKLDDLGTVTKILSAVFGDSLSDATTDEYGA